MNLAKLSLLLILSTFAVIAEYTVVHKTIPNRDNLKDFLQSGSSLNFVLKKMGFHIKSALSAPKIGNVCRGVDDYIFYCPTNEDDTLLDQYSVFRRGYKKFQMPFKERLKDHQAKVHFLTIPNKIRMYPEKLLINQFFISDGIAPWEFIDERELGELKYFSVGRVKQILSEDSAHDPYHRQDTHWNSWGAYQLIRQLDLNVDEEDIEFDVKDYPMPDLIQMCLAQGDKPLVNDSIYKPTSYKIKKNKAVDGFDAVYINQNKEGRVLVIGDSYRLAFGPVIAQFFARVDDINTGDFAKKQIDLSVYDSIFIIQVERNLRARFR